VLTCHQHIYKLLTRRHCVAVCCSVLQCVAVCCSVLQCVDMSQHIYKLPTRRHCVAVCCSALQCVAVCCSVLQCVDMSLAHIHVTDSSALNSTSRLYLLQCGAMFLLQCVAVRCSVLHRFSTCSSAPYMTPQLTLLHCVAVLSLLQKRPIKETIFCQRDLRLTLSQCVAVLCRSVLQCVAVFHYLRVGTTRYFETLLFVCGGVD